MAVVHTSTHTSLTLTLGMAPHTESMAARMLRTFFKSFLSKVNFKKYRPTVVREITETILSLYPSISLSLSYPIQFYLSFSLALSPSLSLALFPSLILSLSLSLSLSLHTLCLFFGRSLSLTACVSLCPPSLATPPPSSL